MNLPKITAKQAGKTIWTYLLLTLFCFIFSLAWEGFMIPNGMSAGGMMGLCTIIQFATNGAIEAQTSYFVMNTALIVIAVIAMGIGFGFKTIYCIVASSVMMKFIGSVDALQCIPGQFFYVDDRVLIPIIAGALEALGLGMVLRYGGSTGGTDIVALMVHKYWPISLSTVFMVSDFVVVALLLLLPDKSFGDMIYGVEQIMTFTLMVDFVVGGKKSSYQLIVFSEKYEQIADHIINVLDRGVTLLPAVGWYTKQQKNVLLILIDQKELPMLNRAIKSIDPRAFMSVSPTNNVYGEGFEEMKVGFSGLKKEDSK